MAQRHFLVQCKLMSCVKAGDRIAVHYLDYGPAGEVVATTEGGPPLQMVAGGEDVIAGLSLGVIGMRVGEQKMLALTPSEAFGASSAPVERTVERSRLPADVAVGDVVRISVGSMSALLWIVEPREPAHWCVSTQHPRAGQTLDIQVQVMAANSG